VALASPGGEVTFEPLEAQQMRVPPGEVGLVEFAAKPRSRPFLGGQVSLPFTARVQAPDQQSRNLNGEVVTRGLLPTWVLPAVLVVILGIIATVVLVAVLGGEGSQAVPTQLPATEAPPAEEATQPPPEEPTAEPPPEEPTAEPPPVDTEEPPGSGEGPDRPAGPCASLAFGLVLVPLLVRARSRE
jgi:hypothetical protein